MHKYSVALILTYAGKFPNYFPLWLKSAGANPDFTFMIFTDADASGLKIPDNIQIHYMTIEEIRQRASKHLGFEAVITKLYKLCEYKPLYGLIFEDYLAGYDFWGHVDPDIVWGNIENFVTDSLLDEYNRLFRLGHFELYRNTDEINHFILHELPGWNISYKDAYRVSEPMAMDEGVLTELLFSKFTYMGGGCSMIELFLLTSSRRLRTSGVNCTKHSRTLLRSDGLTANCTGLLSAETLNAKKNICMSISRRGP